jgi:DNA-binding transcriptional LysR family regulator
MRPENIDFLVTANRVAYYRDMESRHIRYFRVAAEEEHFGRAADRLNVSQPALSQQIRDLERELGVELFDRLPRGVSLSSAGRVFLEGLRPLLRDFEELRQRTRRAARGEVGRLRIALNEFAMAHEFIASGFKSYRKSFPEVQLDILPMVSRDQIDALHDDRIDAGFLYCKTEAGFALSRQFIALDAYVLAMTRDHPLASRKVISLRDLEGQPFISMRRTVASDFFAQLQKACTAADVKIDILQEVDNHATVLDLVSVGMGLAFVVVCRPTQLPPSVTVRKVRGLSIVNKLELAWKKGASSPALAKFVELMSSLNQASQREQPRRRVR